MSVDDRDGPNAASSIARSHRSEPLFEIATPGVEPRHHAGDVRGDGDDARPVKNRVDHDAQCGVHADQRHDDGDDENEEKKEKEDGGDGGDDRDAQTSDYDRGSDDDDDDDDDGPGRLVVSLTTTPWRIDRVLPVLRNLVEEQTRRADAVHLYVPAVCKRNGQLFDIPQELEEYAEAHPVLRLSSVLSDYGPATKLMPALIDYRRPDDRIVTVDDDVLLHSHTIEELCAGADRHPGAVVGMIGCTGDPAAPFLHAEMIPAGGEDARVHTLGGYRGVLYPRRVWAGSGGESLWDDYQAITQIVDPFLSDDHLFGWNLYRRDVPCYVVVTSFRPAAPPAAPLLDRLNFRFLDLGAALTDPGSGCSESVGHLRALYQRNGWKCTP